MKILLITYEFPPSGGVAVQRALSFAKYLPESGCEMHVLTARNPASPVLDPALVAHIPDSVSVHRVWTPEPSYYFRQRVWRFFSRSAAGSRRDGPEAGAAGRTSPGLIYHARQIVKRLLAPDPHVLWTPLAYVRACRIIEKHGIQVVLTTVPPFSLLMLANRLKRRFPDVHVVSDFRDEWRRYFLKEFEFLDSPYIRQLAERIEREAIQSSTLVVAATRSSLTQIRQAYTKEPDEKFAWIPNGYDPESFRRFTPRAHTGARMIVTYIGTAYTITSPRYYLDAVDELPEAIRSRIETRFIGRVIDDERRILEGRKSVVQAIGFLPQAEAFRWMEETDYLLVTVTNDFAIAGKLFEYLATGKPILAISPLHGETARLIRETRMGWCVDPSDLDGIKRMLTTAYERTLSATVPVRGDVGQIRSYERPRLAAELAGHIRTAVSRSGRIAPSEAAT